MTAIAPHIRVLRAEAAALEVEGAELREKASSDVDMVAVEVLVWMASAKRCAADALEAEEKALEQRLTGGPQVKGH